MSAVRRISTDEARALLAAGYTYVDVRTEAEYAAGHPAGAVHVPFLLPVEGGMAPNAAFVRSMKDAFGLEDRLVLGCASGQRSARAAAILAEAGFTALADLRPGFLGVRDAFGQLIEKGWQAAGLPVEFGMPGNGDESSRRRT